MIKSLLSIHHNDIVMVKLNEAGLNEYEHQMIKFRELLPPGVREEIALTPKNLDSLGRYRLPLWALMMLFGHLLGYGEMPPWDGNIMMEVDLPDFDC